MPVIAVGGQAKDIGKTALVCNIVSAFPERKWTAVKITNHEHQISGCKLLAQGAGWSIVEQTEPDSGSDTARYLKAGAARGLLVQAEEAGLREAMNAVLSLCSDSLIFESNRAVEFLSPDLFLLVVDAEREFKPSAQSQLEKADALVWRGAQASKTHKLMFPAIDERLDPGLESLIRERLR